jgi:hypothetical protein
MRWKYLSKATNYDTETRWDDVLYDELLLVESQWTSVNFILKTYQKTVKLYQKVLFM